jgi:hypothetical protein
MSTSLHDVEPSLLQGLFCFRIRLRAIPSHALRACYPCRMFRMSPSFTS